MTPWWRCCVDLDFDPILDGPGGGPSGGPQVPPAAQAIRAVQAAEAVWAARQVWEAGAVPPRTLPASPAMTTRARLAVARSIGRGSAGP